MAEFDSIKVKDQLGRPEDKALYVKRKEEVLVIEDSPCKILTRSIGHSWIVGSSTNGLVGTNTGTADGSQQVVGGANRVDTLKAVVSSNRIFREHFYDTEYKNTSVTTADWGVIGGELNMTSGEIAQSEEVAYDDGTIYKVLMSLTFKTGSESLLTIQVSSDGGSNWTTISLDTVEQVSNSGTDLRFKLTASGTVDITELRLQYIIN